MSFLEFFKSFMLDIFDQVFFFNFRQNLNFFYASNLTTIDVTHTVTLIQSSLCLAHGRRINALKTNRVCFI
jgi:hypothetical protein